MNGGRPEDIRAAQAAVDSAQAKLKQVQDGAKDGDIKAAEQQVQAAQATFDGSIATLNKLRTPNPDELAVGEGRGRQESGDAPAGPVQLRQDRLAAGLAGRPESVALQQATADYQNALAQLQDQADAAREDIATAQKQVDSARALLDANKAKLDQLKAGSTTEDLTDRDLDAVQAQQTARRRVSRTPTPTSSSSASRSLQARAEPGAQVAAVHR